MTSAEYLTRAQRWSSWDGTLSLLTEDEKIELQQVLSLSCFETLWDLPYTELRAAADLLTEHYNRCWREEYARSSQRRTTD